jgi:hypothetical protein
MTRDQFQRLALVTVVVLLATVASNRLMAYTFGSSDRCTLSEAYVFEHEHAFEDFDVDVDVDIDHELLSAEIQAEMDRARAEIDRAQAEIERAHVEAVRAHAEVAAEVAVEAREIVHVQVN